MKRTYALLPGALLASLSFAFASTYDARLFAENALALDRPATGRAHQICTGGSLGKPNVFYIGVCNGRCLEDYRLRPHVVSHLRRPSPPDPFGALANRRIQSQYHLCRPAERGCSVPDPLERVTGCTNPSTPARHGRISACADGQQIPQIAGGSVQCRQAFRRRSGTPLRTECRARAYIDPPTAAGTFEKILGKDEKHRRPARSRSTPTHPDNRLRGRFWERRARVPGKNSAWTGPGRRHVQSPPMAALRGVPLTNGIPSGANGFIQANIAISPSNTSRLYASIATSNGVGIYRSDDAGEQLGPLPPPTHAPRDAIGGGDLSVPTVDPRNPDTVYVASTVTWKIDRRRQRTWTGFRGAPGGDDYQRIWINPNNPDIILNVSDQGAIISVNGGANPGVPGTTQPTAQMYHVNADNDFPYRVLQRPARRAAPPAFPAAAIMANSPSGNGRPWASKSMATPVPDPLDPNIVFGGKSDPLRPGAPGKWRRRRSQAGPGDPNYRTLRTASGRVLPSRSARPCSSRRTQCFAPRMGGPQLEGNLSPT